METSTSTYREMLIHSGHYTDEMINEMGMTEEDCEAEYQEITLGGH